ncbi:MAG: PAS domain-containing protein [Pseudomonadota bacterium]
MFIISVAPDQTLRFGGLNAAHERETGMSSDAVSGKTPHEVLPPRLADTVCANYRACLTANTATSYEEELELPTGKRWWRTSLTPVREGRTIAALIGSAVDITPAKERAHHLAVDSGAMRRQVTTLQTLAFAATTAMRGPLNNIVSLGRMLRTEFRPPLERKEQLLSMMIETAVDALDEIDRFENDQELAQAAAGFGDSTIDVGHLCRDVAAMVDPDRALSICFPEAHIVGPTARVAPSLQAALRYAATRAETTIRITLHPDATNPDAVHLRVGWDGTAETRDHEQDTRLRTQIDSLGGSVLITENSQTGGQAVLDLTVPGVLQAAALPSPRVSLSRRATD